MEAVVGGREGASDMKIKREASIRWPKETFCKSKQASKKKKKKNLNATSLSNPEFWGARAALVNIILQLSDPLEPPHVQKCSGGENKTGLQIMLQSSSNFT